MAVLHLTWRLLMGIAALAAMSAAAGAAGKRVALVVGNSNYEHAGELTNPRNDATDMTAALRRKGFVVVEGYDLDRSAFEARIREFAEALRGAEAGLFFYAGHGLQVRGRNYLVPVDAELTTPTALDFEMVRLDTIHTMMANATSTNLVFLDACRNNPLARNLARAMGTGTRSATTDSGLAPVDSGVGTLFSFSTQPGNVALDGAGRNSPYSGALVRQINASQEDLFSILIAVRNDVIRDTGNSQVPWDQHALTGRFYFDSVAAAAAPKGPGAGPQQAPGSQHMSDAQRAWAAVRTSNDLAALESVFIRYRDTLYADLAWARIQELKQTTKVAAAAPVGPPLTDATRQIVDKVKSSVVSVEPEGKAPASGFVVSSDGHVLTSHRAIQGANRVQVGLGEGRKFEADIVGSDAQTDIARLKVRSPQVFFFAKLSERKAQRGDRVLLVGRGSDGKESVTPAIVSSDPRAPTGAFPFGVVTIDATLDRDDLGAAAFSLEGEVVGLTTTASGGVPAARSGGPPAKIADAVIVQLRPPTTARGWIGVRIQNVDAPIATAIGLKDAQGIIVSSVAPQGPAAGRLRSGDVVTIANGARIVDAPTFSQHMSSLRVGSDVTLRIWRDNKEQDVLVKTVAAPPAAAGQATGSAAAAPSGLSRTATGKKRIGALGLTVGVSGAGSKSKGVVVVTAVETTADSPRNAPRPDDTILEVAGQKVESIGQIEQAVSQARRRGRTVVLLQVQSGELPRYTALTLRAE
jgi:uncharacterized caspase-like protein